MHRDQSNIASRTLFLDPAHCTPQYNTPLVNHLKELGVLVDRGWQIPLHGDTEQPEFLFFRVTFRFRHWFWRMSHCVWRTARGMEYLYDTFRLRRFIRKRGHSLIHYNWLVFPALDFVFMRWLQKQGIAVVLTVHNMKPHDSGRLSIWLVRSYRQADHLIALSDHVKNVLISEAGITHEKVTVIPHGDLHGYLPGHSLVQDDVVCRWRPSDSPLTVCLGAIRPYKGVPDLLRAWPMVIREIPNARLLIAGQLREDCREEVATVLNALGEAASTVFTEFAFLSPEKYQSYLQAATVLVQPYRSASQSGNTVHAYSCGVPVVCTRVGGLPEMVEEGVTGSVAELGDSKSLAAAIVRILRGNANGEMSLTCREFAETRYGWEYISKLVLSVYANAASNAAGFRKRRKRYLQMGVPFADEG